MKELLINQIAPIATTAIVAILVAIVKNVGGAAIELFAAKKNESELKIKASGHEAELNTAKEVWNIIEEKFRITDNAKLILGSKADEFDNLLLSRIPGLTQNNLYDLRQAVAGEMNKYKNVTVLEALEPATITGDTTSLEKITALQETNAKLEYDKAELQARIDQINSALNPGATTTDSAQVVA